MEEQIKNLSNEEIKSLYKFIKKEIHKRKSTKNKVVINKCFGGFRLSSLAIEEYKKRKNIPKEEKIYDHEIKRNDPILIDVVLELKEKAQENSELRIVEISDLIDYTIEEYDGIEWIAEKHKRWE